MGIPMLYWTTTVEPPKKRSNKMHTQRAVSAVLDYVRSSNPQPSKTTYVNTQVEVDDDAGLTVTLFSNPIMRITRTNTNDFDKVYVYAGGCYTSSGNPSDTTRERLNGLLAALGDCGVIPLKVRVFMDWEYDICYVGSGDKKIALNEDYATMVSIDSNPEQFFFEDLTNYKR